MIKCSHNSTYEFETLTLGEERIINLERTYLNQGHEGHCFYVEEPERNYIIGFSVRIGYHRCEYFRTGQQFG